MDLDGSIFWWFAGALVLAALVISAVGIRGKADFPPSGRAMWGILAVFALVVVGTGAYAIANASEEKEHREQELAEEEEAAAEENSGAEAGAAAGAQAPEEPTPTTEEGPAGQATTLDVTSPEDGGLSFEPSGLEAPAGVITLAYENPSPVPHNIALEDESQEVLDQSDDVTAGSVEITAELAPGEYAYFCAIPGHREAGMEGALTVD